MPQMGDDRHGDDWHDYGLIELLAVLAMTVLIAIALHVYEQPRPLHTSFIVPSQTTRW
jgi:hypothetical protein